MWGFSHLIGWGRESEKSEASGTTNNNNAAMKLRRLTFLDISGALETACGDHEFLLETGKTKAREITLRAG